jgi:3-oxoadipate enol-lactonase
MTEMTVAGETFNVLVEGDETKPALMISNPLGVNLRLWEPQMPALLEHFRVIRYDSRGHGSSVADEGPYSIAGLGQDALAMMDALGLEKVHWLGLSKGAMVGQWLLVHASERIGRAVLANTAAQIANPDIWNERIQSARETGMGAVAEVVADRWFTRRFRESNPDAVETILEMLRRTPLQGYVAAAAALRDMDLREAIRSIANPVLVIVGRHDPSTPPGLGALVANSINSAKLVTLEASHISNIEDAENFTRSVIDFLTAVDAPAERAPARRRAPPKKSSPAKSAARKSARKKSAPAKKSAAPKKAAAKKALKKTQVKQVKQVKKAPVKKNAAAAKGPARKAPAKKAAAKAPPARRAAAKKIPAKKAAAKSAPIKAPKKTAGKKTAGKKNSTKQMAAKKTTARKPVGKIPASKKGSGRKKT